MGFSVVPLMSFLARRAFLAAGLRPHTTTVPSSSSGSGGGGGGADAFYTLHYWAPPGEPQRPPLMLVHGFGPMATWQWRRQVGPLSRHFHLVVPDLLLFGGSSSTSPAPPSEAAQAAALSALLDALPGFAGRRVAVAGTSYGGFVAYCLARTAGPERVGPVVISSSDLLKTAADDQELLARAGGEWAGTAELLMPTEPRAARRLVGLSFHRPSPALLLLPDFVLRDTIKDLFMHKREEKIELLKAVTVGTDEFRLTPLPQDVLLIWGEHDQIFPLAKAFAVKRCLGEKIGLEIFKKTGHVPQMEDPNRFNRIVLDFLLAAPKSPPI